MSPRDTLYEPPELENHASSLGIRHWPTPTGIAAPARTDAADAVGPNWGCVNQGFTVEDGAAHARRGHAGRAAEIDLAIAHEVNQPLAAIALHAAAARKWLCRAEPNVERALASLDLISEAGRHAGDVMRAVKRLACDAESDTEPVNVDQAIHDVLRLLQCNLHKQCIRTELALNLDSAAIHVNRVQFQQVMTNLLVNAIEALSDVPQSDASRYIRVGSRMANQHDVEITVEDNGPGIAPAHRDRIFSSRFTTKAGNSGVGLAISRAIVRAHHGCIEFEPRKPQGARFCIRFPATPASTQCGSNAPGLADSGPDAVSASAPPVAPSIEPQDRYQWRKAGNAERDSPY